MSDVRNVPLSTMAGHRFDIDIGDDDFSSLLEAMAAWLRDHESVEFVHAIVFSVGEDLTLSANMTYEGGAP